jgi:hypothetical protein
MRSKKKNSVVENLKRISTRKETRTRSLLRKHARIIACKCFTIIQDPWALGLNPLQFAKVLHVLRVSRYRTIYQTMLSFRPLQIGSRDSRAGVASRPLSRLGSGMLLANYP